MLRERNQASVMCGQNHASVMLGKPCFKYVEVKPFFSHVGVESCFIFWECCEGGIRFWLYAGRAIVQICWSEAMLQYYKGEGMLLSSWGGAMLNFFGIVIREESGFSYVRAEPCFSTLGCSHASVMLRWRYVSVPVLSTESRSHLSPAHSQLQTRIGE